MENKHKTSKDCAYLVPNTSAIESNDGGKYESAFKRSKPASDKKADEDGAENVVAVVPLEDEEDEDEDAEDAEEEDKAAPFLPGNTVL